MCYRLWETNKYISLFRFSVFSVVYSIECFLCFPSVREFALIVDDLVHYAALGFSNFFCIFCSHNMAMEGVLRIHMCRHFWLFNLPTNDKNG